MILLQINTICLVLAASSTLAEYSTHESEEEDDAHYRDQPPVDYSQYFNGMGRSADPSVTAQPSNQSTGFVQPLDFNDFFQSNQFGLGRAASPQVFQSPGTTLPINLGGFPVQERNQTVDNPAGFVDDMQFRSLFDTSGSASEPGFNRPRDFSGIVDPESSYRRGYTAPAFVSLQKDVDREVDYQRREEDAVERSRAAQREPDETEDEEDDDVGEFDSAELDDFPASGSGERSKNKYSSGAYNNKYGDVPKTSDRKPINQPLKSAHIGVYSSPNPRPVESKHRKPYTGSDYDYGSTSKQVYDEDEVGDTGGYSKYTPQSSTHKYPDTQRKNIPIKTFYHSLPIKEKNLPSKHNDPYYLNHPRSQPNYPGYSSGLSYPVVKPTSYNSPQGAQYHSPTPYYNKSPSNFRPSPRDTYLDSISNSPQRRASYYPRPKPVTESRSQPIPQTDYSTAIQRRTQHPSTKSSCKKIQKKMADEELSRFKRQQMTCYICTNKEKGNTYEECSYESEPQGKSFYKGSAETYSTETVLPEPTLHSRTRRSSNKYFESVFTLSKNEEKPLIRRIRQYHYAYDPDEQGHGPENYRFPPEYVQAKHNHPSAEPKQKGEKSLERYAPQNRRPPSRRTQNNKNGSPERQTSRKRIPDLTTYTQERRNRPHGRTQYRNYENEEDDYDDDTDIEKEYQPPGASDDDDCQRVDKDGLVCMVCQNSKSGGTYEQCSYASDPDANRYEYSRQKTYGNPRNPDDRYKRYTVKSNSRPEAEGDEKGDSYNKDSRYSNNRRNNDFKNGKSKRKKVRPNYNNKRPATEPKSKRRKFTSSKEKDMPGVVGLDPYFYGRSGKSYNPDDYNTRGKKLKRRQHDDSYDDESEAGSAEDDSEENPTYEDSFFRLFPELIGRNPYTGESIEQRGKKNPNQDNTKEDVKEDDDEFRHPEVPDDAAEDEEESESKQSSNKVKLGFNYGIDLPTLYFDEDESKKDLEKALDEFQQKNRSDCKKVIKDKMTCYQCLDKNNMQHEECMFVAATEPKSKHLAYHEVKQFRMAPENNTTNNSTLTNPKASISNNSSEIRSSKSIQDHRNNHKHQNTPQYPLEPKITRRKFSPGVKSLRNPTTQKHVHFKRFNKPKDKLNVRNISNSEHKGILGEESKAVSTVAPMILTIDSEGQPALVFDILKIKPKSAKIKTHNTTSNIQNPLQRKKRKPSEEDADASASGSELKNKQDTSEKSAPNNPNQSGNNEEQEEEEEEESPNTRPRYNSVPEDPEGFRAREGPEGAYSHETEPVFDPVLKMSLPKYMLSRSEHERIFDEVLRSG